MNTLLAAFNSVAKLLPGSVKVKRNLNANPYDANTKMSVTKGAFLFGLTSLSVCVLFAVSPKHEAQNL